MFTDICEVIYTNSYAIQLLRIKIYPQQLYNVNDDLYCYLSYCQTKDIWIFGVHDICVFKFENLQKLSW